MAPRTQPTEPPPLLDGDICVPGDLEMAVWHDDLAELLFAEETTRTFRDSRGESE